MTRNHTFIFVIIDYFLFLRFRSHNFIFLKFFSRHSILSFTIIVKGVEKIFSAIAHRNFICFFFPPRIRKREKKEFFFHFLTVFYCNFICSTMADFYFHFFSLFLSLNDEGKKIKLPFFCSSIQFRQVTQHNSKCAH